MLSYTSHPREPLCTDLLCQIYKFTQSSLAELARNSVIQSGFEMEIKRHWLGHQWYLPGSAGNDINKVGHPVLARTKSDVFYQTNVPNIRLVYRHQTLMEELRMVKGELNGQNSRYSETKNPGFV